MGKNLQHQDSTISIENGHHPGCMRGILHHFNNRKWHNVKRRLPYKRNSAGKLPAVVRDPGTNSAIMDDGEVQGKVDAGMVNTVNEGKFSKPAPAQRFSMRSRIKALITEDKAKRRARHHRSSSYPERVQLEQIPPIHHLEASNPDPCTKTGLNDDILDHQDHLHSSITSLLDPLLPNISDGSKRSSNTCELCAAAMLNVNYLRQNEVREHDKQPFKDRILLQDSSIYAIERSKNVSLHESRLFLNALDLLNIREELFLKVLQDPNSSLLHYLHGHKPPSLRLRFTKSMSFPLAHSSDGRLPRKNKQEVGSPTKGESKLQARTEDHNLTKLASSEVLNKDSETPCKSEENKDPNQLLLKAETQDDSSEGSWGESNDQHNNTLAIKHFKNLREKIKYAIKERKKERRRIIMDAILHKVPYGRRHMKDVEVGSSTFTDIDTEKCIQYASNSRSDQYFPSGKSEMKQMKRTSSFDESFDRYNRLLELYSHREVKNDISDSSKLRTTCAPSVGSRPALLGRILSLPDLRSNSLSRIDGSSCHYTSETSIRPVLPGIQIAGSCRFGDQSPTRCENRIQLYNVTSESGGQGKLSGVIEAVNYSSRIERNDTVSHQDFNIKPSHVMEAVEDTISPGESSSNTGLGMTPSISSSCDEYSLEDQTNELRMDSPILMEKNIVISEIGTPIKQSYSNLLHVQVDTRNHAEFSYVRDILELSGFIRNEFPGKWHSTEQPLDPSVYEEVERQLESFVDEEGGCSNHLVLFFLINEILLDIYEKSFSYWPVPLTCRSHVHPMPVGYRVLEDVWANVSWYLNSISGVDPSLDDAVARDLAKRDGWMNIQFEAECVGLELEDMIFDDLLDELLID